MPLPVTRCALCYHALNSNNWGYPPIKRKHYHSPLPATCLHEHLRALELARTVVRPAEPDSQPGDHVRVPAFAMWRAYNRVLAKGVKEGGGTKRRRDTSTWWGLKRHVEVTTYRTVAVGPPAAVGEPGPRTLRPGQRLGRGRSGSPRVAQSLAGGAEQASMNERANSGTQDHVQPLHTSRLGPPSIRAATRLPPTCELEVHHHHQHRHRVLVEVVFLCLVEGPEAELLREITRRDKLMQ